MCLMDMGKTRHADGQTGVSDAIEQRAVFFDFFADAIRPFIIPLYTPMMKYI